VTPIEDQKYAVIGLGLFGKTLARQLSAGGAEVIAIDIDPKLVQEIADDVAHAVALDATDVRALQSQGVDQVDTAIVAIGENFEGNILCTLILKQSFALQSVITRAMTMAQYKILALMDVRVLQPEKESAARLATRLLRPGLIDNIQLAENFNLVQLEAPSAFYDRALRELDLRSGYSCNVVSIRHAAEGDGQMISVPHPDELIREGDVLYLIGSDDNIERLTDDLL
jgi:trk system potassium uptake protein